MRRSPIALLTKKVFAVLAPSGDHRIRLVNIGHLLTGNLMGSLLGLAALALSARALGPVDYGILALVATFVRVVERVVNFQSWQPMIKYGVGAETPDRRDDLRSLLKFGFLLDAGAALAAFAVAVLCAFVGNRLFGWSDSTFQLMLLYSTVLLVQISGVPTAVQRLAGNFRLLAYWQLCYTLPRVALCALGLQIGADIFYFAAVWAGTQALSAVIFLALAMHQLRVQGVRGVLTARLRGVTKRFPGIWGFAWSANLSLTMRVSSQELDTLIVGALTDPSSAGLYHIAKRFGRVAQQFGAQVQAVIYPDVARMWAAGRIAELKRVVIQVEAALFSVGALGFIAMLFLAEPFLRLTAGPQFVGAASLLVVQMAAVTLVITGAAARSALLAMGRQQQVVGVVMVGTAVFHIAAFALIPQIGAMGGNVAHILLGLVWVCGLGFYLHRALNTATKTASVPFAPSPSPVARSSAARSHGRWA